jgi:hypothetical protein
MWKTNAKSDLYYLNLHEDMNKKRRRQSYGARSYIKLMLNKLKVVRGLTFIYTHGGIEFMEASMETSTCAPTQEATKL